MVKQFLRNTLLEGYKSLRSILLDGNIDVSRHILVVDTYILASSSNFFLLKTEIRSLPRMYWSHKCFSYSKGEYDISSASVCKCLNQKNVEQKVVL
jgi:hypothetical protein